MAPRPARAAAALVVLLVLLTATACRERPPAGGPVTLVFKHAKILGPADPVPGLLRRFEARVELSFPHSRPYNANDPHGQHQH